MIIFTVKSLFHPGLIIQSSLDANNWKIFQLKMIHLSIKILVWHAWLAWVFSATRVRIVFTRLPKDFFSYVFDLMMTGNHKLIWITPMLLLDCVQRATVWGLNSTRLWNPTAWALMAVVKGPAALEVFLLRRRKRLSPWGHCSLASITWVIKDSDSALPSSSHACTRWTGNPHTSQR